MTGHRENLTGQAVGQAVAPVAPAMPIVLGAVDTPVSTDAAGGEVGRGAVSSPMVAALEDAWGAIRARHPEVPNVVIIIGAGSGGRAGEVKLGHYAALRWAETPEAPEDGSVGSEPLAEVFVGGEGLARGPVDVLGTLLHEAAHALADVRGVQDTSRQGRYHNARFKALAEELGIAVTKDPSTGWSPTTVTDTARTDYVEVIEALGRALRLRRAFEGLGFGPGGPAGGDEGEGEGADGEAPKKPGPPRIECGCGRRIRIAAAVLALGPITCGLCGQDFAPQLDEDDQDGDQDDEQDTDPGADAPEADDQDDTD